MIDREQTTDSYYGDLDRRLLLIWNKHLIDREYLKYAETIALKRQLVGDPLPSTKVFVL